jgi:polyisoprenoid-binding protein YceI
MHCTPLYQLIIKLFKKIEIMENITKWVVDSSHSEILFKVKHLMITNVKGEFRKFDIAVETEGNDFSTAKVKTTIDASSIFTNEEKRDGHLKSEDFFDVENHKELVFESTSLKREDDDEFEMKGNLTIRGVKKEVKVEVEFGGLMTDPYGNEKAGFSIEAKINRKDWGLNWNAALEAGGVLVGEEVKIMAEIQLVKQG